MLRGRVVKIVDGETGFVRTSRFMGHLFNGAIVAPAPPIHISAPRKAGLRLLGFRSSIGGITMSLSDLASLGSFVSGIAVLASLVYLSLQVRQAERNQRAIVQQARISRSSDQLMHLTEPSLARVWLKIQKSPGDATEEEAFQFMVIFTAMLRNAEDVWFQHELNLLDAASLNNQLGPLRSVLSSHAGATLWKVVRRNYDEKIATRVDTLVPADLGDGQYGALAAWKAEIANMKNPRTA